MCMRAIMAPMAKKQVPAVVSEYMAQIGAKGGKKGGKATGKKGLAAMPAALRREIALKGVAGRRKKNADIQNKP